MPSFVAVMETSGSSVTESTDIIKPDDPFSGPLKSIAPWNYTFLACLMFIVTSLSLTENFTVMLVTLRYKQLRKPLNYIIVNLSVADFLVSLIGGTISFLTNAHGYFFLGVWACVLEGFAVTFFGIVALWSLAILAFERFFVICRPLKDVRLGGKHAAMGLVFVWIFSFIWTFPPVVGWNSYTISKIGTTCEPNWYSTDYYDHTYIITFFTTCFILPLGVIIISYGKLMQKLRKVSNTHGRLGNARKPDREVARMVIVMIIAFMVGWTPYAAFSIIVTACPTIHIDPRLGSVPAFFSKTAAVYNPIIYVFMNKQFRKCLIQMFKGNDISLDSTNINQTSDKGAITATVDSHLVEMSTIAARIPISMCNVEKSEEDEEEEESDQSGKEGPKQQFVSDSRVCSL
ncbi:LOW QUALITY PROTEIN: vertebrate ancient long opsin b [Triplophysa dalaica]|uniref:LOW QUALITY PROTEIN: vertebrate ancient long opsin b n=1 Tax=Triplophysa dalaica TaxID=1582913 RepID=UPI0024E02DD5|nr:LOW QUALITY PROTEIN: vertebrate ancient long opsin b [Triplophysa dalaica]